MFKKIPHKPSKRLYPPKKHTISPAHLAKLQAGRIKHQAKVASQVTVVLKMAHNQNGIIYGPGKITVSQDLAIELTSAEQMASQSDDAFYGNRAVIIGGRGKTGAHLIKDVPVETFNSDLEDAQPFTSISGRS